MSQLLHLSSFTASGLIRMCLSCCSCPPLLLSSLGSSSDDASSVSPGPGEAVAGCRGDPAVLSPLPQGPERGLLSPPPGGRGDAAQVRPPPPQTAGGARPALPQPLRAAALRGRLRLLRSGARDVRVRRQTLTLNVQIVVVVLGAEA